MDKIELVYNLYKDESIGSRKFRAIVSKKYQLSDRDITNIYAKINNYQVKKYGKKIGKGSDVEYLSREEYGDKYGDTDEIIKMYEKKLKIKEKVK